MQTGPPLVGFASKVKVNDNDNDMMNGGAVMRGLGAYRRVFPRTLATPHLSFRKPTHFSVARSSNAALPLCCGLLAAVSGQTQAAPYPSSLPPSPNGVVFQLNQPWRGCGCFEMPLRAAAK